MGKVKGFISYTVYDDFIEREANIIQHPDIRPDIYGEYCYIETDHPWMFVTLLLYFSSGYRRIVSVIEKNRHRVEHAICELDVEEMLGALNNILEALASNHVPVYKHPSMGHIPLYRVLAVPYISIRNIIDYIKHCYKRVLLNLNTDDISNEQRDLADIINKIRIMELRPLLHRSIENVLDKLVNIVLVYRRDKNIVIECVFKYREENNNDIHIDTSCWVVPCRYPKRYPGQCNIVSPRFLAIEFLIGSALPVSVFRILRGMMKYYVRMLYRFIRKLTDYEEIINHVGVFLNHVEGGE